MMKGLSNLSKYKYNSVDKSLSSKILNHYWNFCMYFIPKWIAPNLITFIGLMLNVSAFVLITIYRLCITNAGQGIPSWLGIYSALCIWFYSTLDNLDGKQARRTNTSSPLGELFDHGCDSVNILLGSWIQINAMGLTNTADAFLMVIIACVGFFTSTWEHFHTSILYLGYVSGPSEGIILSCAMILASAKWGSGIWMQEYSIPMLPMQLSLIRIVLLGIFGLFFIFVLPFSIVHISKAKAKWTAPLQLVPFCGFLCSLVLWTSRQESGILNNASSEVPFFLFLSCAGIVFSKWVTLMNLNFLLRQSFPLVIWSVVPMVVFSFGLHWYPVAFAPWETAFLAAYLPVVLVDYLWWVVWVIRSFCVHLGINCFTIPAENLRLKRE